jgi:hypothetical protein
VEAARIPLLEENDFVAMAMTLFMGELLDDFRQLVGVVLCVTERCTPIPLQVEIRI